MTLKNRFANSFAQIEVQLKRRYDLIPNLVETAKGYMAHERETLEAVVAGPDSRRQRIAASRRQIPATRRRCRSWPAPRGLDRRAGTAVRPVRVLPGPEGQPEHDAVE